MTDIELLLLIIAILLFAICSGIDSIAASMRPYNSILDNRPQGSRKAGRSQSP